MLATRFFVLTMGLLIGGGIGHGQTPLTNPQAALTDPQAALTNPQPALISPQPALISPQGGQPITPVRIEAPRGYSWAPPTEVVVENPLHASEHMELEVAPAATTGCECGQAKCPGVCRDPGRPKKPLLTKPGDRNRGDCPPYRYRMSDQKRAGNPHCVAPWAACSVNSKYSAWFVGGGAAFCRGRCRKPTEGTWGLDYGGFFGRANVWLKYSRGREQGGEGAYETDGEPEFVTRTHEFLGIGH